MKQPRCLLPTTGTSRGPGAVTGRPRPATRGGYPMSIDAAAEHDRGRRQGSVVRGFGVPCWGVPACGAVGAGGGTMRGPGAEDGCREKGLGACRSPRRA